MKKRFDLQGVPDMAEQALDGLQQVMTVKSRVVLPYLVPQVNINMNKNIDIVKHTQF